MDSRLASGLGSPVGSSDPRTHRRAHRDRACSHGKIGMAARPWLAARPVRYPVSIRTSLCRPVRYPVSIRTSLCERFEKSFAHGDRRADGTVIVLFRVDFGQSLITSGFFAELENRIRGCVL